MKSVCMCSCVYKYTLILWPLGLLGLEFDLLLVSLSQHLPLESSHGVQKLVAANLRGRKHDAAIQKAVNGCQQVPALICQICCLVKLLSGQETQREVNNVMECKHFSAPEYNL